MIPLKEIRFYFREPPNQEFEEYTAIEGMTWAEFIDSEYNTLDFSSNNRGVLSHGTLSVELQGHIVYVADTIEPDGEYEVP